VINTIRRLIRLRRMTHPWWACIACVRKRVKEAAAAVNAAADLAAPPCETDPAALIPHGLMQLISQHPTESSTALSAAPATAATAKPTLSATAIPSAISIAKPTLAAAAMPGVNQARKGCPHCSAGGRGSTAIRSSQDAACRHRPALRRSHVSSCNKGRAGKNAVRGAGGA